MKVGLVVLNYNDWHSTIQQIERLKECSAIDRFVVVDNASPNESYTRLRERCDGTWDLIQTGHNGGYGSGNNAGIQFLIERYGVDIVGIANPDAHFDNFFVEIIKNDFQHFPEYALLSGVEMNADGIPSTGGFWRDNAWIELSRCNYITIIPFLYKRIKRKIIGGAGYVQDMLQTHRAVFEVQNVVGSLFFVRADIMQRIGGFDENVFLYKEEDILAQKIRKIGGKLGIDPQISFVHAGSVSINSVLNWKAKQRIKDESDLYFFREYVTRKRAWLLLFRINLTIRWVLYYLKKRN